MLDRSKCTKLGAVWAIGQGLLAALAPGKSAEMVRKMLGMSFRNVDELEPRPEYLRQTRAIGIGLVVAGIAGLMLEAVADESDAAESDTEKTDAEAS